MKYSVFKMSFPAGIHFGNGFLNDTSYTFAADTLFSALYIEALHLGCSEEFFEAAQSGQLRFSDAMPYIGDVYMLPKPMVSIEGKWEQGSSVLKKKNKNLKYLPASGLEQYLAGTWNFDSDLMRHFGKSDLHTAAAVRREEDTLPYHVGIYYFFEGNGLYVIVAYQHQSQIEMVEDLFQSLSLSGIGGKRASGLGKFELYYGKNTGVLGTLLEKTSDRYMTLSVALPREEEMELSIKNAHCLLGKRSGFVASDSYAEEYRKKRDLYVFTAGSCFEHLFEGDIYDVSIGGNHPVYRYAKPLFVGV